MAQDTHYDIFVIGGGINGCGIARDAAGRGYSVGLAEMKDFASGTSSGSTKLIHGGLRYLEHYEFRLVREALMEREVLWHMAPHIIWPLRFVLPHHKGLRPAWLLRLGLFLYDHLGGRKDLPATRGVNMGEDVAGQPLKPLFTKGFEYSDAWVEDSRLVVLNAMDAGERGADIFARTKVTGARRQDGMWRIELTDEAGLTLKVTAAMIVNAAGPWVDVLLNDALHRDRVRNVRLVQGSHIVVKRLYPHDRCYIFQNGDGRIIFAIPYEQDFTLIGTTDRDYHGDPRDVAITSEETDYLLSAASEYFTHAPTREDVVWTYSAVRPLYDDGAGKAQETTRDYVLDVETENGTAPIMNIFGGKITTYRRLAEAALEKIGHAIGVRGTPWTADHPLPGGDFKATGFDRQVSRLKSDAPFLPDALARRWVRAYGTRARRVLGTAREIADLGQHFGAGLYEAEIRYLVAHEWARDAGDVLWRRTKLGLRLDKNAVNRVQNFLNAAIERPQTAGVFI